MAKYCSIVFGWCLIEALCQPEVDPYVDPYADPYGGMYGDEDGYGYGGQDLPMEIHEFSELVSAVREQPLVLGLFNIPEENEEIDEEAMEGLSTMFQDFLSTAETLKPYGFRFAISQSKELVKRYKVRKEFPARVYIFYPTLHPSRLPGVKSKEKKRYPGASPNTFSPSSLSSFVSSHYFHLVSTLTPSNELAAIFSEHILLILFTNTSSDLYPKSAQAYYGIKQIKEAALLDTLPKFFFADRLHSFSSFNPNDHTELSEQQDLLLLRDAESKRQYIWRKQFDSSAIFDLLSFAKSEQRMNSTEYVMVLGDEWYRDLDELDPYEEEEVVEDGVRVVSKGELEKVLEERKRVLVMFYAEWCGHCKRALPELMDAMEQLSEYGLEVVKMKADEEEAPSQFSVTGFPTIYLVDESGAVTLYEQAVTKEELLKFVKSALEPKEKQDL